VASATVRNGDYTDEHNSLYFKFTK